jgi:hypothetical protein
MLVDRKRAGPETLPRRVGGALALCAALYVFAWGTKKHLPLSDWLTLRYLGYGVLAGTWSLSCIALGHVIVTRLLGRGGRVLEHLAISLGVGVGAFELALFLLGLARGLGTISFFALPLACLALGGRSLFSYLLPFAQRIEHARRRGWFSLGWLALLAIVFGSLCFVALYLPMLSPQNTSYDARWRHLFLAEQYAVYGGVRRFAEGWVFGTSPHQSVMLYTWAFTLPFGELFDRVELSAHLEFVTFFWTTMLGIPAMVRRLAPGANPAVVWAARFLFPGVLLYDSNLNGGTDHLGAVFAPALLLLALRAQRHMNVRVGMLLGAMIGAAAAAKETTALLLVPGPVLAVVFGFVIDARKLWRAPALSKPRLAGAVAAGIATLVFAAPHWLKNVLWHGDPLYPNLYKHVLGRPWSQDSAVAFEHALRGLLWSAPVTLDGLRDAIKTLALFSFVPHAWREMHFDIPTFGFLFTLFLLPLPFVRHAGKIWRVVAWVHVAILAWYWIHHEDRHLQGLVPWMAASVAATATLLWRRSGSITRALLVLTVGAQIAWGADMYFYPTHSMLGRRAPIQAAVSLLERNMTGRHSERLVFQTAQQAVGNALPKDAILLTHEKRDNVGIRRTVVTDFYGEQCGIDYQHLLTPDRVYAHLRSFGITHLMWSTGDSRGYTPLAGDLVFYEFAFRATAERRRVSGNWVASMPARAPAKTGDREVAVLGCAGSYTSGMYRLSDLATPRFGPRKHAYPAPREALGAESAWVARVFAIAVDVTCGATLSPRVARSFEHVVTRNTEWGHSHSLWIKR